MLGESPSASAPVNDELASQNYGANPTLHADQEESEDGGAEDAAEEDDGIDGMDQDYDPSSEGAVAKARVRIPFSFGFFRCLLWGVCNVCLLVSMSQCVPVCRQWQSVAVYPSVAVPYCSRSHRSALLLWFCCIRR
jgi:hypothetical protein